MVRHRLLLTLWLVPVAFVAILSSQGAHVGAGGALALQGDPWLSVNASATWSVVPGSEGLTVQFNDETRIEINVASWYWDFGDGFTSTERNPVHTYPGYGDYTVFFTVLDSTGRPSETKLNIELAYAPAAPFNWYALAPLALVAFAGLAIVFGRNPYTRVAGAGVMFVAVLLMVATPPTLAVRGYDWGNPFIVYALPVLMGVLALAGFALVRNNYVRIGLIMALLIVIVAAVVMA